MRRGRRRLKEESIEISWLGANLVSSLLTNLLSLRFQIVLLDFTVQLSDQMCCYSLPNHALLTLLSLVSLCLP